MRRQRVVDVALYAIYAFVMSMRIAMLVAVALTHIASGPTLAQTISPLPDSVGGYQRQSAHGVPMGDGAISLGWFIRKGAAGRASIFASNAQQGMNPTAERFAGIMESLARQTTEASRREGMTINMETGLVIQADGRNIGWCRVRRRTPGPEGLEMQIACMGFAHDRFVTLTVDALPSEAEFRMALNFARESLHRLGSYAPHAPGQQAPTR